MLEEPLRSPLAVLPGRLLLNLGALGLLLLLAAQAGGLPGSWERAIRGNSAMWGMGSAACAILGVLSMWSSAHGRATWTPTLPGRRFSTLVLFTRGDCPLCEESAETLARYRTWLPEIVEVDIADDAELQEEFEEWIPVVEIDGRIRFKGTVNEFLLRRLIEGTPPALPLRTR